MTSIELSYEKPKPLRIVSARTKENLGYVNASVITPKMMREVMSKLFVNGGVTMTLLGSSRSGKTTFLINELLPMFEDSVRILFTPSYSAAVYNPLKTVEDIIVMPSFDSQMINLAVSYNSKEEKLPFVFILDDIVKARNVNIDEMFLTLRNLKMSTIVVTQYYSMVKPEVRQNVNFSFYFRINSEEGRKKVVANLLSDMFVTQGNAHELYDVLTSSYAIMSDNISGKYYLIPREL
jgi:hypothetical protein